MAKDIQSKQSSVQMTSILNKNDRLDTERPVFIPVEQVEDVPSGFHADEKGFQIDDIHEAALVDNPETAERLSAATILAIVFLGQAFVAPLSLGFIVAVGIQTSIGGDLNNLDDLSWIISGWSIAASVSTSLGGSVQDIFGRRPVILAGDLVSLIGAIVAATAQTLDRVIAGSTLLGLGCGLVSPYAAVVELVPNKYRALAISWVEFSITLPWTAMGVLIGNLFVLHANWRWVYYVAIIYAAVVLVGTAVLYFPPPRPMQDYDRTRWQQFLRLDFVGYALYTTSLTALLLGLSWGGSASHPWDSASVVAPIVLAALGLIAVFFYDFIIFKDKGRPIFPKDLFQQYREFTVSLVCVFVAGMVYFAMSGLLPQATLFVYTSDPLELGKVLLTYGFGQFVASALVPLFLHRTKNPKRYLIIALAVQLVSTALYAYGISFHRSTWIALMFFGQGCFGLITVVTNLNISLHVRPSELGIATGLLGTFRSCGGSVGNVIFNTILRTTVEKHLGSNIAAAAVSHGFRGNMSQLVPAVIETATGDLEAFGSVKGIAPAIEQAALLALKQTYAQAFRLVFYSTIPFSVVALIAAFFVADGSRYMTNHIQVRLANGISKNNENKKLDGKQQQP